MNAFIHSRRVFRRAGFANYFPNRLARQKQLDVNPYEPPEASALLVHAGRRRRPSRLLVQNVLAPALQNEIPLLVFARQLPDELTESQLPTAAFFQQPVAIDQPLESWMAGKPAKIGNLAPYAYDPEPGIQKTQETKHTDPNPIGRHEHACRTRLERLADVIPERGLHDAGPALRFPAPSRTLRKASVTTEVAFLNSGRSCATSGDMSMEGGITSRIS